MNKYNAQINDFLKIGGEAFWWEVGAGFGAATTILGAGFGSEAGIMDGGPLSVPGVSSSSLWACTLRKGST